MTDYTDYYNLSMSKEYLNKLPDSYFKEKGINRLSVEKQMVKLRDAIKHTKESATSINAYNEFGNPSFEDRWNVENCSEVWSVRQAIMNGAVWDNISFRCIDIRTDMNKPPCSNCQITFEKLYEIGEE